MSVESLFSTPLKARIEQFRARAPFAGVKIYTVSGESNLVVPQYDTAAVLMPNPDLKAFYPLIEVLTSDAVLSSDVYDAVSQLATPINWPTAGPDLIAPSVANLYTARREGLPMAVLGFKGNGDEQVVNLYCRQSDNPEVMLGLFQGIIEIRRKFGIL